MEKKNSKKKENSQEKLRADKRHEKLNPTPCVPNM